MSQAVTHDISPKMARDVSSRAAVQAADLPGFRALILFATIASVMLTWPLWSLRAQPPLLPAIGLPPISLGLPLIVACLAALRAPRAGAIVVTALLAYGMATDQTRMQPEFFSLPILLWGSLPSDGARLVARAHLISLWFFAGLHKALSPAFLSDMGPYLFRSLRVPPPEQVIALASMAVIVMELGTAMLAILPQTRKIAAWTAFLLHVGTVIVFAAQETPWNTAVWPWNLVLATGGFALIAPWRTGLAASIHSARRGRRRSRCSSCSRPPRRTWGCSTPTRPITSTQRRQRKGPFIAPWHARKGRTSAPPGRC